MSGVNWNLGLAQDVGGNAFASFQKGQEQRRVDEGRNALTGYVTNPNDDTLKALAPHQPEFVLAQKQKQQQQAQEQEERQIIGDALTNPDPAIKAQARQRLAYTNSELYMKLDENQRKDVGEQMKSIGQLAFNLLQLPDDQIGPATDNALANMQTQGFDTSGFKRTGNPRQDLLTVLATTGQLDEWEKFSQPRYVPVGEQGLQGLQYGKPMAGGPMVNSSTQQKAPAAPATKADYDKLPAGAQYTAPDGSIRTKPGGASSNASGGFRPVNDGVGALKRVFPNARVTSGYRDANHPLSKKNPDSFHTRTRAAADMAPIPGMTFQQAKAKFEAAGYYVHPDSRDEVNNPSNHATGPHWHFVLGDR
jgi:hypothetical protein